MYKRYGSGASDFLNEYDFDDFIEHVNYVLEQRLEELILERWIHGFQDKMSIQEFKEKIGYGSFTAKNVTKEDVENILNDVINAFKNDDES